jgi:hypothetical protein
MSGYTYPPLPPTLSGDLETISRFLQSPTQIRRRLRDYVDLRFISDQILTNRWNSTGGAALYEQTEPFVTDRPVQSVAPGSEYPQADAPTGTGGIAAVQKWGQMVPLTDEQIDRNVYAGQIVDRTLQKVVNSVIAQVDNITMSAVMSTVSLEVSPTAAWDGSGDAAPTILRDVLLGVRQITGQLQGYNPDTLLVTDVMYAYMMSDLTVSNLLKREDSTNPIYTGEIEILSGLTLVHSPHAPNDPLILDSAEFGGMADEISGSPGWAISDLAVQIKSIRNDRRDRWELQGRRITVPIIQNPNSACAILGASGSEGGGEGSFSV